MSQWLGRAPSQQHPVRIISRAYFKLIFSLFPFSVQECRSCKTVRVFVVWKEKEKAHYFQSEIIKSFNLCVLFAHPQQKNYTLRLNSGGECNELRLGICTWLGLK
jgi:hypothetical protein